MQIDQVPKGHQGADVERKCEGVWCVWQMDRLARHQIGVDRIDVVGSQQAIGIIRHGRIEVPPPLCVVVADRSLKFEPRPAAYPRFFVG